MPRIGVNFEEVELQAETLVAKGENPTIERIRRALGDRGSNSTISRYLNEWRTKRHNAFSGNCIESDVAEDEDGSENRRLQRMQDKAMLEMTKLREETRLAVEEAHQQKYQVEEDLKQTLSELQETRLLLNESKGKHFQTESELLKLQKQYDMAELHWQEAEKRLQDFKLEKEKQAQELLTSKDQTIQYLKDQIQDLMELARRDHQKFTEEIMEKEKGMASLKTELLEIKRVSEDRKTEKEQLQANLRSERETIGRLEERISQIRTELELAQLFTKEMDS